MAEIIQPTSPSAHSVRTYLTDYAGAGTDSEGEAQFALDSEDEELHSVATRLQQNREFLENQITPPQGERTSWILEPQPWLASKDIDVVLVRKPTASNLSHRTLNPFIYRNIQDVGTLDNLASLLDSPDNWQERYVEIMDNFIPTLFQNFRNLPDDTLETTIQSQYSHLVSCISTKLNVFCTPNSEKKIIVGGILAKHEYDIRSRSDPLFSSLSGTNLIATEVKTHQSFGDGEMWYHKSRGIQVLTALYAFNCPTFLFSQKQWKLFVENKERNSVFTYPYGDEASHSTHVNSSQVYPMGTTFLKAIVICLLSERNSEETPILLSTAMETPPKQIIKQQYFDTVEKQQKYFTRSSVPKNVKTKPTFISGYKDELPVYSEIRVHSDEVVARIEDEIILSEKVELEHQASESTLF